MAVRLGVWNGWRFLDAAAGWAGRRGDDGDRGVLGGEGEEGWTGPRGPTGARGPQGEDGLSPTGPRAPLDRFTLGRQNETLVRYTELSGSFVFEGVLVTFGLSGAHGMAGRRERDIYITVTDEGGGRYRVDGAVLLKSNHPAFDWQSPVVRTFSVTTDLSTSVVLFNFRVEVTVSGGSIRSEGVNVYLTKDMGLEVIRESSLVPSATATPEGDETPPKYYIGGSADETPRAGNHALATSGGIAEAFIGMIDLLGGYTGLSEEQISQMRRLFGG